MATTNTSSAVLAPTVSASGARLWTARIVQGLVVLFLLFDAIMKVVKEHHVLLASADLGYQVSTIVGIGATLLVCTLIYVVPRTAVLGAVLLTGYLGGAVASNVRVGHTVFECAFPIIVAALVWGGLYLQDRRVRDLISSRR